MKNPKRKNKPAGRPREDRERLVAYVKKETLERISKSVNAEANTPGKVLDKWASSAN